jgi:predicted permease
VEGKGIMNILVLIVLNVILPTFSLIVIGMLLHRKFNFEMKTLSKLNTYLLLPAVGFVNIYESEVSGKLLLEVLGFLLLLNFCLALLCTCVAKVCKFDRGLTASFANSVVLSNSGNFGLPVSQLVFHNNSLGLSIQIVVTIFQNFLSYTYGLFNAASANYKGSKVILEFFKLPISYALIIGLLLHNLGIKIPFFLWKPIENISNAFLAIALITLGAQVAYLKIKQISSSLLLSIIGRLLISPAIALAIILLLGLKDTTAQALFIASSYPTSRNSALLALEYNNHPDYAAQVVLVTTLLSIMTVTIVVFLSKILF